MNPDDILKAAPAIAKGAGALAAAIPLTPIIKAILGHAADELGQRFGDRVRLYRYGRSLDMLKKAEKMAKDAGFTPKTVPIKLLFPLLEGASFEEDEDLLANAASPDNADKVRPAFISVLKQMSPDEAAVLKFIADLPTSPFSPTGFYPRFGSDSANPPNIDFEDLLICLDGLEAVKLLRNAVVLPSRDRRSDDESIVLDDDVLTILRVGEMHFLNPASHPNPKPDVRHRDTC